MAIQFEPGVIESFFGVVLANVLIPDSDRRQYWIDYSGKTLRYSMILDVERDDVKISGDLEHPWSGESMYEFNVPCSTILTLPGSVPSEVVLAFYYGAPGDHRNLMLTLMKRRDGDLVVWPRWPYPKGHPYAFAEEPQ